MQRRTRGYGSTGVWAVGIVECSGIRDEKINKYNSPLFGKEV